MSASDKLDQRIAKIAQTQAGKPGAARAKFNVLPNTKVAATLFPSPKAWVLLNTDTQESIIGQFPPTDVQKSVGSSFNNTFALNRKNAITQFLHGNVETISFSARFYSIFMLHDVESKVKKLERWAQQSSSLGRPPILYFWVGNQHVKMRSCFLTDVSISYDRPGFLGTMQGATVGLKLQRYEPFSLANTSSFDTLYHFAKLGDTYELLAARHYKNPMLGVELRHRHPKARIIVPGTVIKLPAPTGSIRRSRIAPRSVALRGILERRENPQRLSLAAIRLSRSAPSTIYTIED